MITLSIIAFVGFVFSSYKTLYEKHYENNVYNAYTIAAAFTVFFLFCFLMLKLLP